MANKVLSIEIGQDLTRVIEVDYKSNKPKIYKYFSFPTPEGTISDGIIGEKKADFSRLLRGGLRSNGITTDKVVFAVSAGSIASREVAIPIVKENKIQNVLLANSSEYFPVDLSQYQLAYRLLEKDDENKQLKLQVYAIPKKLVESYEELAKVCNLTVQAIDYVGNSVYQLMQKIAPKEMSISVKVDEGLSLITIVKDGKVELQRSVAYGIEGVTECISDSKIIGYKPQYEAIFEYMRTNTCVHKNIDRGNVEEETAESNPTLSQLRDEATESLRYLVGNISRVLDYYTSRNSGVAISQISLLGIGAECMGLKELLSNELGVTVTTETMFDQSIPEGAANYLACVGAVLNPLDIAKEVNAKKGQEGSGSSESLQSSLIIFGVGAFAALLLTVIPLVQNFNLNTKKIDLEDRLEELQPAQEAYDAYLQAQNEYTDAATMDAMATTPNDGLLDFLQELEEKSPSNITMDNMTAGITGVTLSLKAENKEQIGDLITQLRQFKSVGSVETSGFSEEKDDAGNVSINCSITCTYALADGSEDAENATETDVVDTTDTNNAGE
ncbi:pilus assembly protein PilM [Roseburia sp. 499]|uniref:pilus assembly protein PilM n=1 Tax=Roseburia sp. 499 TaxID=1261634 RepID=UPI000952A58C|nr:pilus assembly protein PilM [Roseburia sp. 499]WVK70654.1 pilus assembly protein PilM [Roseburia sp. 499]